jgi:hypothetical protein
MPPVKLLYSLFFLFIAQFLISCSSARLQSAPEITAVDSFPAPPPALTASTSPDYSGETGMGQQAGRPVDNRFAETGPATAGHSRQATRQYDRQAARSDAGATPTANSQRSVTPVAGISKKDARKQLRSVVRELKAARKKSPETLNAGQQEGLSTQGWVGIGLLVLGILFIAASPAGFLGGLLAVIFGIALGAVGLALLLMDIFDVVIEW